METFKLIIYYIILSGIPLFIIYYIGYIIYTLIKKIKGKMKSNKIEINKSEEVKVE